MKQSIYQKLLLSLAIVAFFSTMLSAQVLTREDVSKEKIETAKLRHQQIAPKAIKKDAAAIAKIERDIEDKKRQVASGNDSPKSTRQLKRKVLDTETIQKTNSTDIRSMRMTKIKLPNGKTIVTDANNKEMVRKIMEANSN